MLDRIALITGNLGKAAEYAAILLRAHRRLGESIPPRVRRPGL